MKFLFYFFLALIAMISGKKGVGFFFGLRYKLSAERLSIPQ